MALLHSKSRQWISQLSDSALCLVHFQIMLMSCIPGVSSWVITHAHWPMAKWKEEEKKCVSGVAVAHGVVISYILMIGAAEIFRE